jgi:hypothetical protein
VIAAILLLCATPSLFPGGPSLFPGGIDERATTPPVNSPPSGLPEGPSAAERAGRQALEHSLDWLAEQWDTTIEDARDGSFPKGNAREWAPVGVTALGALALMSGGNAAGRGPHGDRVAGAIEYLLNLADLSPRSEHRGYIAYPDGDRLSRTHGHGYATLALAQAYGMSPRGNERLKAVLIAATALIESSQGSEGGWYYEPEISANHEGSVTVCLVQALRAARNAGIRVNAEVIHRAEDYVLRLRKEDGTFRYQLDVERSSAALTAACIGTLNMAGRYDDAVIQDGINAIWRLLDLRRDEARRVDYPYYERLYLAQALWQLSDRSIFDQWFAEERTKILREQRADGSWSDVRYGDCYATAMNSLVLAIPEGLLPIFQR